jgi:hypothetical protein
MIREELSHPNGNAHPNKLGTKLFHLVPAISNLHAVSKTNDIQGNSTCCNAKAAIVENHDS